jgi:hypothetical protein
MGYEDMPPRGLMGPCWKVVQEMQDTVVIVLDDTPKISWNVSRSTTSIPGRSTRLSATTSGAIIFKRSGAILGIPSVLGRRLIFIVDIAGCVDAENAGCKLLQALPTNVLGKCTV